MHGAPPAAGPAAAAAPGPPSPAAQPAPAEGRLRGAGRGARGGQAPAPCGNRAGPGQGRTERSEGSPHPRPGAVLSPSRRGRPGPRPSSKLTWGHLHGSRPVTGKNRAPGRIRLQTPIRPLPFVKASRSRTSVTVWPCPSNPMTRPRTFSHASAPKAPPPGPQSRPSPAPGPWARPLAPKTLL